MIVDHLRCVDTHITTSKIIQIRLLKPPLIATQTTEEVQDENYQKNGKKTKMVIKSSNMILEHLRRVKNY